VIIGLIACVLVFAALAGAVIIAFAGAVMAVVFVIVFAIALTRR
jgi:hypothetical protein